MVSRFGAPVLKALPPEAAHNATIALLSAGLGAPSAPPASTRHEGLAVTLPVSGLRLPNPVGLAAGFDKDARAYRAMLNFGFGFVECGTVTPRPQEGNPRPRLFRLTEDRAIINRMGFNNGGLEAFVSRLGHAVARRGPVGANVGANKDSSDRIADYVTGLCAVWPHADYITLNISSPNTPGLRGLQDRAALEDLLGRTGEAALDLAQSGARKPLFLKVAPDLDAEAIEEICSVALAAPCLQGLIVSNTTLARAETLRSRHAGETGGLSGAPLMRQSTEILRTFARRLEGRLDLIGAGGITTAEDVRAKLRAGAHAVQIYSALIYRGPHMVQEICRELTEFPA